MVVFTCGHCGESVQKPKVEKHYLTKCRNRNPNLSCMDCFKDFLGKDYEAHIKCVTEEERYSGKGFVAKEKKGEKKQNVWVEMVQTVLDEQKNAPRNVLKIIEAVSKHNNTPRKKPKFINFVKNICGNKTNPKDIDQAWDLISTKLADLSKVNNENKKKKNGTANEIEEKDQIESNNDNAENQSEVIEKDDSEKNGFVKNGDKENGDIEKENGHDKNEFSKNGDKENGVIEKENGHDENEPVKVKKSKKELKEEKKRKKYEAELQSAAAPVIEENEETTTKKKDKKKNKDSSTVLSAQEEDEIAKNKRKRQDTINGENDSENIENQQAKTKAAKKKLKIKDESLNLHDQNVLKTEEEVFKEKFDWHSVIMSVLQKKDNEVPFKRLQKKVLAEYTESTGYEVDDRIADKFIKKLKSAPNVRVDKNRVFLIEE